MSAILCAAEAPSSLPWLLAGPPPQAGPESLADHLARLGPAPQGDDRLIAALAESGLVGRGGARFPTARKWEAVRRRARGRGVVVVNGAETDPASWKDHALMRLRPQLVLDGALLAAESVGAAELVVYVNRAYTDARDALEGALAERRARAPLPAATRLVGAPTRYVAGQETAAIRYLNGGEARPAFAPPRPPERGVRGAPTLVQNVETLALAALIARFGAQWFRGQGTPTSPGPALVTVSGAVSWPGVYEVARGTSLAEVVSLAGGNAAAAPGILVGGYLGRWVAGGRVGELRLEDGEAGSAAAAGAPGVQFGCGVVQVLGQGACGVAETAALVSFLARESARQCGPCQHGLAALAHALQRIAARRAGVEEQSWLRRWADQLGSGRGACRHPDGAVGLLWSALHAFEGEFVLHARGGCRGTRTGTELPIPPPVEGWR